MAKCTRAETCRKRWRVNLRLARAGQRVKRETERRAALASGAARWCGGVLVWRETA